MKYWGKIRLILGILFLLLIIGMIAAGHRALETALGAALAAVAGGWIYGEHRHSLFVVRKQLEESSETFLNTINVRRHDWMNDLQVLYGYTAMKKYDKLLHFVDTIKERLVKESDISKLGVPSLVLFLHTFQTQCKELELDIRNDGEVNLSKLPLDHDRLTSQLCKMIMRFRAAAVAADGEVSRLRLRVNRNESGLRVEFIPNGMFRWEKLNLDAEGDMTGELVWENRDEPRTLIWTVPFAAGRAYRRLERFPIPSWIKKS
jgi:hypothetical protein